jgi:hypothetical protein
MPALAVRIGRRQLVSYSTPHCAVGRATPLLWRPIAAMEVPCPLILAAPASASQPLGGGVATPVRECQPPLAGVARHRCRIGWPYRYVTHMLQVSTSGTPCQAD